MEGDEDEEELDPSNPASSRFPLELVEVAALVGEGKVEARIVEVVLVATAVVVSSEGSVRPEPLLTAEGAEDWEGSELEDPKSSLNNDDQLNREPDPVDEDEPPVDPVDEDEPPVNRLKAFLRRSTQVLDPREDRPADVGAELAAVAAVPGVVTAVPDDTAPIAAAA